MARVKRGIRVARKKVLDRVWGMLYVGVVESQVRHGREAQAPEPSYADIVAQGVWEAVVALWAAIAGGC